LPFCTAARLERLKDPQGPVGSSVMGKIVRNLFYDTAFDPETVKALCDAYDRACTSLHDRGQPDIVNEVIAERIISLAKKGERDPDKLCEGALVALSGTPFFPRSETYQRPRK
ncbi:MAG: hypothetical protein WB041_33010, partial [Pseudolabrys sp.]